MQPLDPEVYRRKLAECPNCTSGMVLRLDGDRLRLSECSCVAGVLRTFHCDEAAIPARLREFSMRAFVDRLKQTGPDYAANLRYLKVVVDYLKDLEANIAAGRGLYITGHHGLWKSGLGCHVLLRAVEAGHKGVFLKAQDFLDLCFSDRKLQLARVYEAAMVVLDEPDKVHIGGAGSDAVVLALHRLVTALYDQGKALIVISGFHKQALARMLGESVADRLDALSYVIFTDPNSVHLEDERA